MNTAKSFVDNVVSQVVEKEKSKLQEQQSGAKKIAKQYKENQDLKSNRPYGLDELFQEAEVSNATEVFDDEEAKEDINTEVFQTPKNTTQAVNKGIAKPVTKSNSKKSSSGSSSDDDLSENYSKLLNQSKGKKWKNNNVVGTIQVGKKEIPITKIEKGRNSGEFVVRGKFGKEGKNNTTFIVVSDGKGGFKQKGNAINIDQAGNYTKLPSVSSKGKGKGQPNVM